MRKRFLNQLCDGFVGLEERAWRALRAGERKFGRSSELQKAINGCESSVVETWRAELGKAEEYHEEEAACYNYVLVDKRMPVSPNAQHLEQVFYVGKGQNDRCFNHQRDAMRVDYDDYDIQTRKIRQIMDILYTGNNLEVIGDPLSYVLEYSLVRAFGLQKITTQQLLTTSIFPWNSWRKLELPSR